MNKKSKEDKIPQKKESAAKDLLFGLLVLLVPILIGFIIYLLT